MASSQSTGQQLETGFDAAGVSTAVDSVTLLRRMPGKERQQQDCALSDASSSFSSLESDDNLKERENWSGRLDFLLSCIGFAVGLGNIWRFPYLCYKSGGGAFLVPYTVFLLLCGLPLFFMEVSLGQFASLSPITLWRITPLFKGVGYGMVIISGLVCIYYNIIITWTFYYLFQSMRDVLPWSVCDNSWNTENCVVSITANNSESNSTTAFFPVTRALNSTIAGNSTFNSTIEFMTNVTTTVKPTTAGEEFWNRNVLQVTSGIHDIGEVRWPLFGCLVLAWTVVFLCLCKGVKSSGKVVKVTATFPYLVLTILLIRGLTLPGAMNGIKFYLIPDFEKIKSFKVWADAAIQIFYSVGMAWGSLITMSSYNKFNNNVYKDAMIVPLLNCGTSVFAGLVIFSVLGFMAKSTGLPVDKVATEGPGLIFIVYPQAVAQMPLPQLWATLFFLMIFTIGLDSQFGMFETMTSAFIDEFPHILRHRKVLFTLIMCLIEFVIGIPLIFQGGIYYLNIMDWYCAVFSLMLLSFTECVLVAWVYGAERFMKDIELMIGYKPSCYWKFMWKFVTPFVIMFIWIASLAKLKPVRLGDYEYPGWAIILGWMLAICSLIPVPIIAIVGICSEKGSLLQRIRKLMQPASNWGPAKHEDRERYISSLSPSERLRYEAAQRGVDKKTYLKMKKGNRSENNASLPNTIIAIEPSEQHTQMLSSASENFPSSDAKPTTFSALLQDEKYMSSNI